jgi:hypothetical protein
METRHAWKSTLGWDGDNIVERWMEATGFRRGLINGPYEPLTNGARVPPVLSLRYVVYFSPVLPAGSQALDLPSLTGVVDEQAGCCATRCLTVWQRNVEGMGRWGETSCRVKSLRTEQGIEWRRWKHWPDFFWTR